MSLFYTFIYILCQVMTVAVLGRAISSWFSPSPYNRLVIFLHQITEPILEPLRRIIPRIGMFDITPMVAIFLLQIAATWAASAA